LSARLKGGEDFASLVAQNSEDEATKSNGGDLGYFSASRMPPDFVQISGKMRLGEITKPVQTRLGFHILKIVDIQQPRQQSFDEVREDIATELANQKRELALRNLTSKLVSTASYLRPL
jgi:parvulin-like peptidyl-prolyl isomerase